MTYSNVINRRTVLTGMAAAGLTASCSAPSKKFDADVIVIGAGLSGLYTAHLIASEGKDVLVLEGSSRVGGRLHTIYHNGQYTEGGGESIGAGYARIIHRANELGISLLPSQGRRRGTAYYYQDQIFAPEDWKIFGNHPLPVPFKGGSAGGALFGLAAQNNPLKSAGDWRSPDHKAFDISAAKFLRDSGLDETALKYVDHTLNANALSSYSMMNVYRSSYLFNQYREMGPNLYVEGGTTKLLTAMTGNLNVQTGVKITAIDVQPNSVVIADEASKTYRAANCVSSIPFGAMGHIKVNGPLSNVQRHAIFNLPYTQIMQVHFEFEKPYWDIDGLPPNMWTDQPMERLFANQSLNGEMTGLARLWINGTGASALKDKTDAQISDLAQTWINKIRPSIGNVNAYHIQRWNTANPLAGGAYMHWAPGQIGSWAETMGRPAGRLGFCGEHLSHLHTGMEGAMESAERAAFHLFDI